MFYNYDIYATKIFDMKKGDGKRHNEGKIRVDLLPSDACEAIAKVFTFGADKYGDRNWERGMDWTKVMASLERHIMAFKKGEDFDPESGLPHMAHAGCNVMMLLHYMSHYPQGDNRCPPYLEPIRIGLDIDEVICDWVGPWTKYWGMNTPDSWFFDRNISEKFKSMEDLDEFYLSLPAKVSPKDIPFEPCCYITSRPVSKEVTEKWIDKNGFPQAEVINVGTNGSKAQACLDQNIDIFVDDRYENFVEITQSGTFCYLLTAPHNERYDVGHRRIDSLKEITKRKFNGKA